MDSKRRFLVASAIAAGVTAASLPGSGLGSSAAAVRGAHEIPFGLAAAIHARLGAGPITSRSAARATTGPELGLSVALSADGTTALVGAPRVKNATGAAYIFHASSAGSWTSRAAPTATLTYKHGAKQSLFGLVVALSADGTTAFISSPSAGDGAGAIFVFHVSTEDAWASSSTPTATLTVSNGVGVVISLALSPDGTTLVAGAPFSNSFAGGAYVFHASSEGAWVSTSTPTAALSNALESQADGGVGFAVAISGDGTTALVGDSENPDGGGAYLYHVSAEDAWTPSSTPAAILTDAGTGSNAGLGRALALSGDGTLALLGAPGVGSNTGEAFVFRASGEAAWASTSTPNAHLTNAGGSNGDAFGEHLALSPDGTTALVFAPGRVHQRGAAYVFRVADEGAWASSDAPTATLTKSGAHANDSLGVGVLSADGATALAGAPGVRSQTGAAYVFHVSAASSWVSSSAPAATLTDAVLAACVVPKLRGMTLPGAKSALSAGRCRLGKVTKVRAKGKKGRVISQSRKPGTRLGIGAKIAVRVRK